MKFGDRGVTPPKYLVQVGDELYGYWDATLLLIDLNLNKTTGLPIFQRDDFKATVRYVKIDPAKLGEES